MSVQLVTLGSVALVAVDPHTDAQAPLLRAGKPLALLAYLCATSPRRANREHLVDLLWGDVDPDRGRQSLRQALSTLRRHLGRDAVASSDEDVMLVLDLPSDRESLLVAIAAGDDEAAFITYSGPYLRGLAFPGAQEFEEWAALEAARLERLYLQSAERLARSYLALGRARDALRVGRAMRDVMPGREASWRLIFQAALALEDRGALALEGDAYQAELAMEGRTSDPATRRLLDESRALLTRPRSGQVTHAAGRENDAIRLPVVVEANPPLMVADLVGREREFAVLLAAWERARGGRATLLVVRGRAGMGKSRLLSEFRARLRSTGGRLVLLRAHPADHDVPWSLASDIVKALCALPGSAGVSSATASVLIALAPSVAAIFPGAVAAASTSQALSGAHVQALTELLAVVSDAPVALAIDDLQWADEESVRLLASVIPRLESERVLVLCAARHAHHLLGDAPEVELDGLDEDSTRALVASLGDVDAFDSLPGFFSALATATGGSPLLILETLQTAQDDGMLRHVRDLWTVVDPRKLDETLRLPGGALRRRLAVLDPQGRQLMLVLALAGAPLSIGVLAAASELQEPKALEQRLRELELRGLVRRRPGQVESAHDEYSSAVLDGADRGAVEQGHRALATAHLSVNDASRTGQRPTLRDVQRAIRHAAAGGDDAMVGRITRVWLLESAGSSKQSDRERIVELLGPLASAERVAAVLRGRPVVRRVLGSRRARVVGAAVLLVTTMTGLSALFWWWAAAPNHLAVVTQPLSLAPMMPAPVVEIRSRSGRPLGRDGDTVRLSIVGEGGARLRGVTMSRLVDGRATFPNLRLEPSGNETVIPRGYRLRFDVRGVPPVFSDSLFTTSFGRGAWSNLRLVDGTLVGQSVDAKHRIVTVHPGDRLVGRVRLDFTTRWGSAAVMLGMTPTWGEPRREFQEITALASPSLHGLIEAPVDLTAPDRPGHYAIIFAFGAEARVDWIFSGTNWKAGTPKWDDGNDVARWNQQQWKQADDRGAVTQRLLFAGQRYVPSFVPATTVRVDVVPLSAPESR
jgi:DNA-binding SARP family transcriptional activator/DNA-binding HxlR family transcriptional regulator